jgi:hypothetical protein
MQVILRNEEQWKELPSVRFGTNHNIPTSYPCLAVGIWIWDPSGMDGYDYEFVYLIDESSEGEGYPPHYGQKFVLDLNKL